MRWGAVLTVGSLFFATSVTPALAQTFPDATCFGKAWTILGTEGHDEIVGTQRADVIVARGGNDFIDGAGGDDLICGGEGSDRIRGSDGNDRIDGGPGGERILGGPGDDRIFARTGGGVFRGGPGDDRIDNHDGSSAAHNGGSGNDTIIGGRAFETFRGGAGNDTIRAGGSLDLIVGGAGNDNIDGGGGFDYVLHIGATSGITADLQAGTVVGRGLDRVSAIEGVVGTRFDDTLLGDAAGLNGFFGARGNDNVDGRGGRDIVDPGPGDDTVSGGDGDRDIVSFITSEHGMNVDLTTGIATGEGTDLLTGFEEIFGSDLDDVLVGDAGNNVITGGIGADDIQARGGDDRLLGEGFIVAFNNDGNRDDSLDGGDGTDTVSYAAAERSIFVDIANEEGRGEGNDTLTSIENVRGSSFGDVLIGDANANSLFGRRGDDVLEGAAGDDFLDGGPGSDRAMGGDGNDTCTRAETRQGCESSTTTMGQHVRDERTGRVIRAGLLGVRRRD